MLLFLIWAKPYSRSELRNGKRRVPRSLGGRRARLYGVSARVLIKNSSVSLCLCLKGLLPSGRLPTLWIPLMPQSFFPSPCACSCLSEFACPAWLAEFSSIERCPYSPIWIKKREGQGGLSPRSQLFCIPVSSVSETSDPRMEVAAMEEYLLLTKKDRLVFFRLLDYAHPFVYCKCIIRYLLKAGCLP